MAQTGRYKIPRNHPTPGESPGRNRGSKFFLSKASHKLTPRKGGKVPKGSPPC